MPCPTITSFETPGLDFFSTAARNQEASPGLVILLNQSEIANETPPAHNNRSRGAGAKRDCLHRNAEMEVTIRRATADDIEEIAKLFDAYRVFFGQGSNLSLAQEFLEDRLSNSEFVIFCAYTSDGRGAAFAQLYPRFSSVSAKRIWILNDLFVLESVRGMGIGTKLLSEIEAFGEESQAKGVLIETTVSNTGAQKLYESKGYQKVTGRFFYERENKLKKKQG